MASSGSELKLLKLMPVNLAAPPPSAQYQWKSLDLVSKQYLVTRIRIIFPTKQT